MAKPIRKTPTLRGKDATNFVKTMLSTERRSINDIEKQLVKLVSGKV